MKRKCTICKEFKKDVKNYVFEDRPMEHTYWNMDMCINCRDEIYGMIDELKIKKSEGKYESN